VTVEHSTLTVEVNKAARGRGKAGKVTEEWVGPAARMPPHTKALNTVTPV